MFRYVVILKVRFHFTAFIFYDEAAPYCVTRICVEAKVSTPLNVSYNIILACNYFFKLFTVFSIKVIYTRNLLSQFYLIRSNLQSL